MTCRIARVFPRRTNASPTDERDRQGCAHAYGSEAFFELSEQYRKLKEAQPCRK